MTDASELSALVVEHIGDIEAAIRHATDVVDVRLWEEVAAIADTRTEQWGWIGELDPQDAKEFFLGPSSWKRAEADSRGYEWDAWFLVDCALQEDSSWVASFVGATSNSLRI